ncbi:hypothetical protein AMK16_24840 [Streptomyces sp. CB00455]|uniref:hypothetical protein n=1 Tax=Streptomyces sp. CB00455 TaxID=1703927 RepID=UPI00093F9CBC|nr:hypothetical protein [Streptomyces sp. CB00455]OKK16910.1 hypothetical protein AMK16_24840 [Streptomyces sp. CB00455]
MTEVFFSDEAEKMRAELTAGEGLAVSGIRTALMLEPRQGERRAGYDPAVEDYVVRLAEETTRGRGISVLYRYHHTMDAVLITWLVVGP